MSNDKSEFEKEVKRRLDERDKPPKPHYTQTILKVVKVLAIVAFAIAVGLAIHYLS